MRFLGRRCVNRDAILLAFGRTPLSHSLLLSRQSIRRGRFMELIRRFRESFSPGDTFLINNDVAEHTPGMVF